MRRIHHDRSIRLILNVTIEGAIGAVSPRRDIVDRDHPAAGLDDSERVNKRLRNARGLEHYVGKTAAQIAHAL
jgi:hypothetical protein